MATDFPGSLRVTLLGTGTSTGVPVVGCACRVCTSGDPRDRRLRTAAYVEVGDVQRGGLGLLIDTGPDLRQQALREAVGRLDAVLYTHHHFDHVAGLDDLRPFFFENPRPMPGYAHPVTAEALRHQFPYIFKERTYPGASILVMHAVEAPFTVPSRHGSAATVEVVPVPAFHGQMPLYGYRIGRFAYLTDTNHIPEASFELLHGLDVLVLDALRPEPHPTHFSFDEAIAAARRIGARQTVFIHLSHNVRHADLAPTLPEGITVGFDGLRLNVEG